MLRLTPRGIDSLARSATIFGDLRARWAKTLGERRLGELKSDPRTMVPSDAFRLDVAHWLGG